MSKKSVLDSTTVNNKAFPKDADYKAPVDFMPAKLLMGIVSSCPACGAPIYGHAITGDEKPVIRRSCDCGSRVGKTETK